MFYWTYNRDYCLTFSVSVKISYVKRAKDFILLRVKKDKLIILWKFEDLELFIGVFVFSDLKSIAITIKSYSLYKKIIICDKSKYSYIKEIN